MSHRISSFGLFVCCCFSVLLMTQSSQKLYSYNTMNKTAIILQEKQRQSITVEKITTGVQNWVCWCVEDI